MIISIFEHALMITGFVFVMMLVIEYINVQTRGVWHDSLRKSKWKQYLLSGFLGATPGCLGAFTVVALYSHRIVSFGALVAAMIATSGDEAFVMLALFPGKALFLTIIIFVIGIVSGYFVDKFLPLKFLDKEIQLHKLALHEEEACICYPKGQILTQLRHCSFQRALLIVFLLIFIIGLVFGEIGSEKWNWIKITLLIASSISLFIVTTVPEHFLEEHLWRHIVKVHVPRIFMWTFGALFAMHFIVNVLHLEHWIAANKLVILIIACLVGLIPESGPHMIFVTLFAQGAIPFSILIASSIVQDGHGMLPMLAESKRGFVSVKLVNLLVGFLVGILFYFIGW
ncbi:MAG: putative manganese transporter [Candidatus Cloacimonadota bacterium]|nr:putative manganese transporter [Candidatus Cloacimonadota bacterium]